LRTVHLPASHADHEPPSSDTRKSLAALQHIRIKVPFFSRALLSLRPVGLCRTDRKYRTRGLATLSTVSDPRPLVACFSLQRSWAFPFRAFLPPGDRSKVSLAPSALALSCETFRPRTGASAAFSRPASRTPVRTLGCYTRSGPPALLGFFGLSGSPSAGPTRKRLPFEFSLSSFAPSSLTAGVRRDLRARSPGGLASPSVEGAGLSDLLHRSSSATFWEDEPAGDYFFVSEILTSREVRMTLLTSRFSSA
jgi:hypothetical protein